MGDVRRQWRRRLLLLSVTLLAVTLSGCGGSGERYVATPAPKLLGVIRTPPLSVGDVTLLDVSGPTPQPVPMKAPAGELYVIYFGYTSCPDICPTTMSDLLVAIGDLPSEKAAKVTVGMTSVDPERDSPEVLREYLAHFFDRSLPLAAADPAALNAATDAFGVRFEVADHEPGTTDYEVSHSAVTYVVDDTGTVVVEWPFGFDSQQMTKDLKTLLEE